MLTAEPRLPCLDLSKSIRWEEDSKRLEGDFVTSSLERLQMTVLH